MARLTAHGMAVDVPPTCEGRIFTRPEAGQVAAEEYEGRPAPLGATTRPLLHVSTTPMPLDVGDFGGGLVQQMSAGDLFIAIKEFAPSSATTAQFRRRGMPLPLDPQEFSPSTLQKSVAGQAGMQVFFNDQGGAYCLYVVIGSFARRDELVAQANAILATVSFEQR